MKRLILALALCAGPAWAETAADYVDACAKGDTKACLSGVRLAQAAGDIPMMVTFSRQGCQAGEMISCSDEGMLVVTGQSDHLSLGEGVALIKRGCAADYSRACTNLGYLHYTGTGMARSPVQAAHYYRIGCDGGSGPACYNLSLMVQNGEISAQTNGTVRALRRRACDYGEARGC